MTRNILTQPIFRDFYIYILKGVSIFAHRARRLSAIDPEIDRFIAEALAVGASQRVVALQGLQVLVSQALEMRERARQLYECAVEPFPDQRDVLLGPATMTIFSQPETLPAQARGLGARKLSGLRTRDDYHWEEICLDKLGRMGALAVSSPQQAVTLGIYDFFHEVLDYLSHDLRAFELIALAEEMERKKTELANALVEGDAFRDEPASQPGASLDPLEARSPNTGK